MKRSSYIYGAKRKGRCTKREREKKRKIMLIKNVSFSLRYIATVGVGELCVCGCENEFLQNDNNRSVEKPSRSKERQKQEQNRTEIM